MIRLLKLIVLWHVCCLVAVVALLWMFLSIIGGSSRAWAIAIGFDQLANATFGGDEDETISSRAWRLRDDVRWSAARRLIDVAFGDEHHCLNAYMDERAKHG